jgi:hypothetical protein
MRLDDMFKADDLATRNDLQRQDDLKRDDMRRADMRREDDLKRDDRQAEPDLNVDQQDAFKETQVFGTESDAKADLKNFFNAAQEKHDAQEAVSGEAAMRTSSKEVLDPMDLAIQERQANQERPEGALKGSPLLTREALDKEIKHSKQSAENRNYSDMTAKKIASKNSAQTEINIGEGKTVAPGRTVERAEEADSKLQVAKQARLQREQQLSQQAQVAR